MSSTIKFVSSEDSWEVHNVIRTEQCGGDVAKRKKADAIMYRENGDEIPISIKATKAECWESGDKIMGSVFRDVFESSGVSPILQEDGTHRLNNPVATKAPKDIVRNVVFGSDILPNGAIIRRSFSKADFRKDDGTIIVQCDQIIRDPEQVVDDVWIMIRNDRTRNSKYLPKGLRGLVVSLKRISRNVKVM